LRMLMGVLVWVLPGTTMYFATAFAWPSGRLVGLTTLLCFMLVVLGSFIFLLAWTGGSSPGDFLGIL
jgi:hypothetical protein